MEGSSRQIKREETYKVIDELFPEVNEEDLGKNEDLFSENEIVEETVQFVNFQVGKELYAVELKYILEIIKVPRISFLPSSGVNILGLINLRGNIIPVINSHKLFEIAPGETTEKSRIIILEIDRSNFGLLVDAVSQVIELRTEDVDLPMVTLEIEKTGYITGEANINGKIVAILDICKLMKNEIFV